MPPLYFLQRSVSAKYLAHSITSSRCTLICILCSLMFVVIPISWFNGFNSATDQPANQSDHWYPPPPMHSQTLRSMRSTKWAEQLRSNSLFQNSVDHHKNGLFNPLFAACASWFRRGEVTPSRSFPFRRGPSLTWQCQPLKSALTAFAVG